MKCLIVTNFFPAHGGGLEIVVGELAEHLVARGSGNDTSVAESDYPSSISIEWIASAPAPEHTTQNVDCIGIRSWNWLEEKSGLPMPVWHFRDLSMMIAAVRRADLVFLNDCLYVSTWLAWIFAKVYRKKTILLQHIDEIPGESTAGKLIQRLMHLGYWIAAKIILPRIDRLVFCSSKVESYFKGRFLRLSKTTLIRNGVAAEIFTPDARTALSARPRILFAGRFVPRKGLEIMYWLARRFPGCDWVFAGWGVIDPDGWGLKNVFVKGKCDRQTMVDLYQSSDLLVLPSTGEGFPLVVQEAISCGLPVLVSGETAGGDPEAAGYLMTAQLDRKSFERSINEFLSRRITELDPSLRKRRHQFAASHWSWHKTVKEYRNLFGQLMNPGVR